LADAWQHFLKYPNSEPLCCGFVRGNEKAIAFTALSADEKKAVASYIDQLGDLYGYCQRVTVTKNLAEGGGEDARTIATTLFAQAVKKFNL
jgi:hypothetical protein